jgi:hypothetical protein
MVINKMHRLLQIKGHLLTLDSGQWYRYTLLNIQVQHLGRNRAHLITEAGSTCRCGLWAGGGGAAAASPAKVTAVLY